jgi:hypothetical protein
MEQSEVNSWAEALDQFWTPQQAGSTIVLSLETCVLEDIAKLAGFEFSSPDEAKRSFCQAVWKYVNGQSRPWDPELLSKNHPPRFLLLIAAQVYAASQMDDDPSQGYTSSAYYVQLEAIVGHNAMGANYAADHGEDHQRLWRERLLEWARGKNGLVHLPDDRNGPGRHVQLPRSQSALRVADIKELPRFFQHCGFKPGVNVDAREVEARLRSLRDNPAVFPQPFTRRVLKDELRFPIACRQVVQALGAWDGRWQIPESGRRNGRNTPRESCWLAISISKGRLITKCGIELTKSRRVTTDEFDRLLAGEAIDGGVTLIVHDGLAVFQHDADDLAFKNVDCVEPGNRCLIAATSSSWHAAERLLRDTEIAQLERTFRSSQDADDEYQETVLEGIPSGCRLIKLTIADALPDREQVGEDWSKFLRSPVPRLIPSGGLRFGKKHVWMVGAGPFIRIVGNRSPKSVSVDGIHMPLDNRTFQHELLSSIGDHHVSAIIDGHEASCRFQVRDTVVNTEPTAPLRAWTFCDQEWPSFELISQNKEGGKNRVHVLGVHLWGADVERPAASTEIGDRLEAIRLLAYRDRVPHSTQRNERAVHPLTRQLQRRAIVLKKANEKVDTE